MAKCNQLIPLPFKALSQYLFETPSYLKPTKLFFWWHFNIIRSLVMPIFLSPTITHNQH